MTANDPLAERLVWNWPADVRTRRPQPTKRHYPGKHDQKSHGSWAKGQHGQQGQVEGGSGPAAGPDDWTSDGSAAARKVVALRALDDEYNVHLAKMEPLADRLVDIEARLRDQRSLSFDDIHALMVEKFAIMEKARPIRERLDALSVENRQKALDLLALPAGRRSAFVPEKVLVDSRYRVQSEPEFLTAGNDFLASMVDFKHIGFPAPQATPLVDIQASNRVRPYHLQGRIVVNARDAQSPSATAEYVHEMGHYLEFKVEALAEKAGAWRDARTAGETPQPLRDLTGFSYGDHEVAKPDRFISPYVGRVYEDQTHMIRPRATMTEVVSMGLEELYRDPVGFAQLDPGHAQLVLSLLQGDD